MKDRMNGADLSALVAKPARTITGILSGAGIIGDKQNGYNVAECLPVIVDHYSSQASKLDEQSAKHRERKNNAEADLAEMKVKRGAHDVEIVTQVMDDWREEVVRGVMGLKFSLDAESKLFEIMRKAHENALNELEKRAG